MDVSTKKDKQNIVQMPPRKTNNAEVICLLKEALQAAEDGRVSTIGIVYISDDGQIVKGSEGNAAYNTALIGGLMSLSISLGQVP